MNQESPSIPEGLEGERQYRLWVRTGVWERINATLVERVRMQEGRNPQPSLIISDSQSVKAGQKRGATTASMAIRKSRGASAM